MSDIAEIQLKIGTQLNHTMMGQTIDILTKIQTNVAAAIAKFSEEIIKDTADAIDRNAVGIGENISHKIISEFKQIMDKSYTDAADLAKSFPQRPQPIQMPTFLDGIKYMANGPTVSDKFEEGGKCGFDNFPSYGIYSSDVNEEKISEAKRQRIVFSIDMNAAQSIFGIDVPASNYYRDREDIWLLSNGFAILFGVFDSMKSDKMYSSIADTIPSGYEHQLYWAPIDFYDVGFYFGYYTGPLNKKLYDETFGKLISSL